MIRRDEKGIEEIVCSTIMRNRKIIEEYILPLAAMALGFAAYSIFCAPRQENILPGRPAEVMHDKYDIAHRRRHISLAHYYNSLGKHAEAARELARAWEDYGPENK